MVQDLTLVRWLPMKPAVAFLIAIVLSNPAVAGDLASCRQLNGNLFIGEQPPDGCVGEAGHIPPSITDSLSAEAKGAYGPPGVAPDSIEAGRIQAIDGCKIEVPRHLKSPGSVRFPPPAELVVDELGGWNFRIKGYVDSQNSYGGLMRTYFLCEFTYVGGTRWTGRVALNEHQSTDSSVTSLIQRRHMEREQEQRIDTERERLDPSRSPDGKEVDFVGRTTTAANSSGQSISFCVKNYTETGRRVTAVFLRDKYEIGWVGPKTVECAVISTPYGGEDRITLEYR